MREIENESWNELDVEDTLVDMPIEEGNWVIALWCYECSSYSFEVGWDWSTEISFDSLEYDEFGLDDLYHPLMIRAIAYYYE